MISRKQVVGLSNTALARFVTRASRAVRLKGPVNVLITSSRELRALNRRFRGKDQPTDVLSFVPDPGSVDIFAGDIAISAEIAKQNARSLGHSHAEEVRILVLHGVLHLAGYDHENDRGAMAKKESKLRRALGLPEGLIERNRPRPGRNGTSRRTERKAVASARPAAELGSARTGRRPDPTQIIPQAETR